jgi:hypothetical protein
MTAKMMIDICITTMKVQWTVEKTKPTKYTEQNAFTWKF